MDEGWGNDAVELVRAEEGVVPFCVVDESTDEAAGLAVCVLGIVFVARIELGIKECESTDDGF